MLAAAHVVIVPTTTAFVEGFNKVVIEGFLAGRPVITSSVCTLEFVEAGVVEVPAEDVSAYVQAILQLKNQPAHYRSKQQITDGAVFYDPSRSWRAAAKSAIDTALNRKGG